jgi:hypothetical protein
VSFQRGIDGSEPVGPEAIGGVAGPVERRLEVRPQRLATGTLACPACDAPVLPEGVMSPADPLHCGYCRTTGAVRDFLSLAPPARPTRVEVRLVRPV